MQEDNFIPAMTARETLAFYADITLPAKSSAVRSQRVEQVLAAVGLTAAANTLVGGVSAVLTWDCSGSSAACCCAEPSAGPYRADAWSATCYAPLLTLCSHEELESMIPQMV
jgi:hypothetical protein